MAVTDLNEASLELTIMSGLSGVPVADLKGGGVRELPVPYDADWLVGSMADYDRTLGLDVMQLLAFIQQTQPGVYEGLQLGKDGFGRDQFLKRVSDSIMKDGVIPVLRNGVQHQQYHVTLYYPTPTPGNTPAAAQFRANRFVITRQVRYSDEQTQRALDLVIFINGLPIFTFELKNTITNQTMSDAQQQYRLHRPAGERLFRHGVCIAHWALDDQNVSFTTKIEGKETSFLPFDKGFNDGAGNPANPNGIRTDYLWKQVFTRESLANILESFVQQIDEKDQETKKTKRKIIFPRYHQLDAVRAIVADAKATGIGQRYLIQHSAGSGKSNTIAWLTEQLVALQDGAKPVFDSVIVVTDRRVLDSQINATMKSMTSTTWKIGHAESSGDLRDLITSGKRVIITTVQKFPFILDAMGSEHKGRTFGLIIDEAHSSMGGSAAGTMNLVLGESDEDIEDKIVKIMAGKKMLTNASYFAFTATPKSKTLELFGRKAADGQFHAFHDYTMKQAIEEGFILDVLRNYTPYKSYYRLVKTIEDDPTVDVVKANKQIRKFVEADSGPIERKARIIVEHFHGQIGNLSGKSRAMVATQGIRNAIEYWKAINVELEKRKWPWRAIVAFTGEHEVDGVNVTEGSLNGFPSGEIPEKFRTPPYRMLIVADKFLTGFDEPLLQTMYVDKTLNGVKAVQTLSRLNRSAPGKTETFVLDFANDPDVIVESFQPFYRATSLSHETDPNKLHDMKAELDGAEVYEAELVYAFVEQYLAGVERPALDAMLDVCVDRYRQLDEDGQIAFKGTAKGFVRTYNFLSQVLPWVNADWERLSIFLTFLTPRLPSPKDESVSQDILEAIDLDSYRADKMKERDLILEDEAGNLDPANPMGGGMPVEAEMDRLSAIVQSFNDLFADAGFTDADRVARQVRELVTGELASNERLLEYRTNTDEQNLKMAFSDALESTLNANANSYFEVFRKLESDPVFKENFMPQLFRLWDATVASGS